MLKLQSSGLPIGSSPNFNERRGESNEFVFLYGFGSRQHLAVQFFKFRFFHKIR